MKAAEVKHLNIYYSSDADNNIHIYIFMVEPTKLYCNRYFIVMPLEM